MSLGPRSLRRDPAESEAGQCPRNACLSRPGTHSIRLALCNLAGVSERRVRYRAPDMLVDATFHAIADVGSIPTVSTHESRFQGPRIRGLRSGSRSFRGAKDRAPNLRRLRPCWAARDAIAVLRRRGPVHAADVSPYLTRNRWSGPVSVRHDDRVAERSQTPSAEERDALRQEFAASREPAEHLLW